ncbi:hypothetical protein [Sulfitobacter sp. SK011]|uniref:hypothetical protein n=1 Tax=Sulfitobacter sp. SK011 TaxID=1389004 RepID=UPI000E0A45C1|nr:hypothetical protein [Sulfitobacter sp. SK011]AXI43394.1 hypothetical protein C1J02_16710 [Sulfitobacter sp. SK011]
MAKHALNSQPKQRIAMLGRGYVGLPLELAADRTGFEVSDTSVATSAARFISGPERVNPGDADQSISVDAHDPWVGPARLTNEHGVNAVGPPQNGSYGAGIVAVGHRQYVEMGNDAIRALGKPGAVLYDIKGLFGKSGSDLRL